MSSPFKESRYLLSEAFDNIANRNLKEAWQNISTLGGNTIRKPASFVYSTIKSKFNMDNITGVQKIIPSLLIGLSVPVTVAAMVVVVAGLSTLAPPFMFAASIAGIARSVGVLISDMAKLRNLNKQFITEESLFKKIDKTKLSESEKTNLKATVKIPKLVYQNLYQLRQNVVANPNLTTLEKNDLIKLVNEKIESFHKGDKAEAAFEGISNTSNTSDVSYISYVSEKVNPDLFSDMKKINELLIELKEAEGDARKVKVSSDLKSKIKNHKKTHEHLYAQDLSSKTKEKMVGILNQPKIKKSTYKEIYAQIANHHINMHSEQQRKSLDASMVNYVKHRYKTLGLDESKNVSEYLASPREIYLALKEIHDNLPESEREAFRANIFDVIEKNPSTIHNEGFDKKLKKNIDGNNENIEQLEKLIQNDKELQDKINGLSLSEDDQGLLQRHREAMLINQIQTSGIDIPSPDVRDSRYLQPKSIKDSAIVQYANEKVGQHITNKVNHLKEKVSVPLGKAYANAKVNLYSKYYGSEEKAKEILSYKENKKIQKKSFRNQFGDAHLFLQKAEERNFLKGTIKQDVLNVGLSTGAAVATGAATIILPAVATPGAPAYVAAGAILGVTSTVFTAGSLVNMAEQGMEHAVSYEKTSKPERRAAQVVAPDIKGEMKHKKNSTKDLSNSLSVEEHAHSTPEFHQAKPTGESSRPVFLGGYRHFQDQEKQKSNNSTEAGKEIGNQQKKDDSNVNERPLTNVKKGK